MCRDIGDGAGERGSQSRAGVLKTDASLPVHQSHIVTSTQWPHVVQFLPVLSNINLKTATQSQQLDQKKHQQTNAIHASAVCFLRVAGERLQCCVKTTGVLNAEFHLSDWKVKPKMDILHTDTDQRRQMNIQERHLFLEFCPR